MNKILLLFLAIFIGGMIAGYGTGEGWRLDIAGYHVHHNVFGMILVFLPLVAFLYRRFPYSDALRRFAWPIAGFGIGIFAHHQITEGFRVLMKTLGVMA